MREKKFTEGPWCINSEFDGNWIEQEANTLHAVCMITAQKTMNEKEVADANLIAAAPELLEALETMSTMYMELLRLQSNGTTTDDSIAFSARQAIAKAKGELK